MWTVSARDISGSKTYFGSLILRSLFVLFFPSINRNHWNWDGFHGWQSTEAERRRCIAKCQWGMSPVLLSFTVASYFDVLIHLSDDQTFLFDSLEYSPQNGLRRNPASLYSWKRRPLRRRRRQWKLPFFGAPSAWIPTRRFVWSSVHRKIHYSLDFQTKFVERLLFKFL